RVVQRRVHLVEYAEGAGLREENAKKQRERHERALTAREQMNPLRALASRRRVDLDVAIERELGILQAQIALAAAEQRHEDLAEVIANLGERREEEIARRRVDLTNRLLQRILGVVQVGALRREKLEPRHRLVVLLDREHVH